MKIEDYKNVGRWLKILNRELIDDLAKSKLPKTSKLNRKRKHAYDLLGKLRSCLDDLLFMEYGEKPTEELIKVFYGKLEERCFQKE